MNDTDDLPLLSENDAAGLGTCDTMRLYLAVWDDLTPEQARMVSLHIQSCPACIAEQRLMQQATRIVHRMEASQPSPHVDQAIRAVIAAHNNRQTSLSGQPFAPRRIVSRKSMLSRRVSALVALAAVVVLASLAIVHFAFPASPQFALPGNLSWSSYVLYHSETKMSAKGEQYHVSGYYDLANGDMHIETVMDNSLDVVLVADQHEMLGMDEMHHVAQWDAQEWSTDESIFDLARLRNAIHSGHAVYQGKSQFKKQDVYRIRYDNGMILLLDMQYRPVNVLQGSTPVYDKLQLLPSSQVSGTMWDMNVPRGYQMGTLPPKP